GNLPGEGVVVLVLKRLADARRDGDRVHAVLRGLGAAHDASSWGHSLQMAMERSFENAAASPSEVAVMELDALGGSHTTADELRAVSTIYGNPPRQKPLLLSSVLPQIGNTAGASSFVSLLKAVLEVGHGELPPTPGLQAPAAMIASQPNTLQVPTARTAIELFTADGRRLAAVGTCSRGLAYHAVLEYGSRVQTAVASVSPTVSFAGTSMPDALPPTSGSNSNHQPAA